MPTLIPATTTIRDAGNARRFTRREFRGIGSAATAATTGIRTVAAGAPTASPSAAPSNSVTFIAASIAGETFERKFESAGFENGCVSLMTRGLCVPAPPASPGVAGVRPGTREVR